MAADDTTDPSGGLRDSIRALRDLRRLPRAFWVVNAAYTFDGFAYFGVLVLLTPYFTQVLHIRDAWATFITSSFAGAITLFMFGFGTFSERFGVRRALIASLVILTAGRALLGLSDGPDALWGAVLIVAAALLVQAIGEGVLQTANYSGLKQYSDERTSAMGFGFNYAIFQLGIVIAGFVSPVVRVGVDRLHQAGAAPPVEEGAWLRFLAANTGSGIEAVFWVCALITALSVLVALLLTRKAEAEKLRPQDEQRIAARQDAVRRLGWWPSIKAGPFGNARFTFFVFSLFPVRTLFAYQIHILTLYVFRVYPQEVADRAEWFSNVVNPAVVMIGIPVFTAFTRRTDMLRLMLIGTLFTALPAFLLCLPERWEWLLAYLILFSMGEALWQPRFYQFAAELAPEGQMGAYMGAALMPWLLAKWISGWYSGYFMEVFCPENGPNRAGTMWAIYGVFALISPLSLWLARNWLRAGLHPPANHEAST